MSVSSSTSIFMMSLLAIPLTYGVNTAQSLHGELGLLVAGVGALGLMCLLTYMFVGKKGHSTDPLFYVFVLSTFASVVDLIIGLENDGVILGFMTQYLKDGEPYLKTAFGTMICYWDGIAHYAMYLMMLAALAWNQSYREVGLYWAGSIGHSMLVFIPGNVVGKYGLRWSFLLNVPYIFIPFLAGARFLRERPPEVQTPQQAMINYKSLFKRPIDILLLFYLVGAMMVAFFRAAAVLGCNNDLVQMYMKSYEPILGDPTAYPKIQMLVYYFNFVPYYVMAIYGLLYPGCSWMPDWSLVHAGAAAQAQVTHIGSSLHHRTPFVMRVPRNPHVRLVFWLINGALLVVPQLLAYRCAQHPGYFIRKTPDSAEKRGHKTE